MSNPLSESVSNFLVPATGSTNAVTLDQVFEAGIPVVMNFANYSISGIPFRPSGVLIDNSQSANSISVEIPEIGYTMVCAAGEMLHLPYPAPINHTAKISGDGESVVVFVDYPVIPFSSRVAVAVANNINVFSCVTADDGAVFSPDSLAQTLYWNEDETLRAVEVVFNGSTYRQSLSYIGGFVVDISEWVKQ